MAGLLQQNHYEMVHEPADADVVLVNTCGFIDAAKAESIDTILEISRLKEEGKIKKACRGRLPCATLSGRTGQGIARGGSFHRNR